MVISWFETHYSVTAVLTEQIEIFKLALAVTFKFLMAVILPVMVLYIIFFLHWFLLWVITNESSESHVCPNGQNFLCLTATEIPSE